MPYNDTGRISLFFEDQGSGGVAVLLLHELGGMKETAPALITIRSRLTSATQAGAKAGAP